MYSQDTSRTALSFLQTEAWIIIIIIPLFTLGSINSTYASGAEQMPETNQIKLNRVKNPNWPEANQLAIYKRNRGFELGTTVNKSS